MVSCSRKSSNTVKFEINKACRLAGFEIASPKQEKSGNGEYTSLYVSCSRKVLARPVSSFVSMSQFAAGGSDLNKMISPSMLLL